MCPVRLTAGADPTSLAWPIHDGEMAERIRVFDWASTPLGHISHWPDRLKLAVELCLSSPLPTAVCWGPGLTSIYNDHAIPTLPQHPQVLGKPAQEAWSNVWHVVGPLIHKAISTGNGQRITDVEATFDYGGGLAHAYYNLTCNPLRDASNSVAGVAISGINISSQKGSEVAFRLALDVAELGVWDWDVTTDTMECSDGFYNILGYNVGDVAPTYNMWATRVHPEDLPEVEAENQRIIVEQRDYVGEYRLLLPDGQVRWCAARSRYLFDECGAPIRSRGVLQDITERHQAMAVQQVLILELQHRTRNLLAIVCSIARATEQASRSLEAFSLVFHTRLAALSRAQGLLSRQGEDAISLRHLLEGELEAHGVGAEARDAIMDGPDVQLPSAAVQILALGLHELATNAVKYGALSQKQASLTVSWSISMIEGKRLLTIDWSEHGVQLPATPSARRGFGRELLEKALRYQLKAQSSFAFKADGVRCTITVPI